MTSVSKNHSKFPKNLKEFNEEEFKNWLDSFDVVLFDCDGCIWLFCEVKGPYIGSNNVVNQLSDLKKSVYLVTNNPNRDRKVLKEICLKFNFNVKEENIVTTSYLAAKYLKKQNFNKTVYVIGEESVSKELNSVGIKNYGTGIDNATSIHFFKDIKPDPEVEAVIVGFDHNLSLRKLTKAATFLKNPNCQLICLEAEKSGPASPQVLIPLSGSIVKVLEESNNRKAVVMGKPSDEMAKILFDLEKNVGKSRFLMVGDTLETDIVFGNKNGMQTLLVGTGVNSLKDIERFLDNEDQKHMIPDFYIDKIADLFKYFPGKL